MSAQHGACIHGTAKTILLDSMHYATVLKERQQYLHTDPNQKASIKVRNHKRKAPASVTSEISRVAKCRVSVVQKLQQPCIATSAAHVQRLTDMHSAFAQALLTAHGSNSNMGVRAEIPAFVPISTVEWDNSQLRWGRKDVPECSARAACNALKLPHSQGPLHAFLLPGQEPAQGTLCLLCLRLHSEMLNKELNAIDPRGISPCLMPPFTNLVNVCGGYHDWSLGVSIRNQRVFDRQCSIVGTSPHLQVRFSPSDSCWWVDQSAIVWGPPGSDFREGTQTQ